MEINKKIVIISIGLAVVLAVLPLSSVIEAQLSRSYNNKLITPLYAARLNKGNGEYKSNFLGKEKKSLIKLPKINDVNPTIKQILEKLRMMDHNNLQELAKKFKDNPNLIKTAFDKIQNDPSLSALYIKLQETFNSKNEGNNDRLATMACPMPTLDLPTWVCLIWIIIILPVLFLMTLTICLLP